MLQFGIFIVVLCDTHDTTILIVDTSRSLVGIVDTYVTIPPRCIVAVKNIVRRLKYREYRDTVQLIPLGNKYTQQACNTKTKLVKSQ